MQLLGVFGGRGLERVAERGPCLNDGSRGGFSGGSGGGGSGGADG